MIYLKFLALAFFCAMIALISVLDFLGYLGRLRSRSTIFKDRGQDATVPGRRSDRK